MKQDEDSDKAPEGKDEIPRQTLWALMPKRSLSRIFLLLCAFAGILYLREKTGAVAGCMGQAFNAPAPVPSKKAETIRASVNLGPRDASTP